MLDGFRMNNAKPSSPHIAAAYGKRTSQSSMASVTAVPSASSRRHENRGAFSALGRSELRYAGRPWGLIVNAFVAVQHP